jgi:hypothetical protein
MKKTILLAVLVMFCTTSVSWALEDGLGVDVNAKWVSKYIWRGFDRLDDKGAFQPSVSLDLYGTGFSVGVQASWATTGGNMGPGTVPEHSRVNNEEWKYWLAYSDSMYEGETYKTTYMHMYTYYDFPDHPSKEMDMHDYVVGLSWPDIIPMGVVPSYTIVYCTNAKTGGFNRAMSGFAHVLGLTYGYTIPEVPELPLTLSAELVYNDGVGCGGAGPGNIDHDWSNIVWGVSSSIDVPEGGKIIPAIYYQTSMDDSVNPEDELWVSVSYGMSF